MINSPVFDTYYNLLSAYVAKPEEKYLLLAEELGRNLMKEDISPEDVVEIHELALKRFGEEYPDATIRETGKQISMPLMEMLMSYGLAFRKQGEQLKREIIEKGHVGEIFEGERGTLPKPL